MSYRPCDDCPLREKQCTSKCGTQSGTRTTKVTKTVKRTKVYTSSSGVKQWETSKRERKVRDAQERRKIQAQRRANRETRMAQARAKRDFESRVQQYSIPKISVTEEKPPSELLLAPVTKPQIAPTSILSLPAKITNGIIVFADSLLKKLFAPDLFALAKGNDTKLLGDGKHE